MKAVFGGFAGASTSDIFNNLLFDFDLLLQFLDIIFNMFLVFFYFNVK